MGDPLAPTRKALPSLPRALTARCLRQVRKLTSQVVPLFAPEEVPLTELILPDCHLVDAEELAAVLKPHLHAASRLSVLHLGFCGKCVTPQTAALLERAAALQSLHLDGCFRLSDEAVAALLAARGAGLSSLHLSANSQLSGTTIKAIAQCCPQLAQLGLEQLQQLPSSALLPLRALGSLECQWYKYWRTYRALCICWH